MNLDVLFWTLWMRRTLFAHDRWRRDEVETLQARALAELREFARARSPFYRRFHRGLEQAPLAALPTLSKAEVMASFDDLVTDRAIRRADVEAHMRTLSGDERYLGRYWANATSGSTGRPGLFLFDAHGWAATLAAASRVYEWAGVGVRLGRRRKQAIVASTQPWHMSARIGATLPAWWTPTLRLDAVTPMPEIVAALNAWQPEAIVAYASMAAALATEQREGRLQVRPAAVVASSEVLTPAMRDAVRAAWGDVLFEAYAATEGGTMAAECTFHRGLHLMDDLNIIEIVDADNCPVGPGDWGAKVLLTSLFNRVQPLIRYEVSDLLMPSGAGCPCGRPFPLLAGIQGREEEILTLPGTDGSPLPVHPNVFHRALELAPVGAWQVVQRGPSLRLMLEGARDEALSDMLLGSLRESLNEAGVAAMAIAVEWVERLPRTRAGKAPLIRVESA